MKNCDVALLTSFVRAIESVPRLFFRPLVASFLIGAWSALVLHVRREAAALDHEAGDHAMEDGAFEEAFVGVLQKVLDGDRRLLVEQLHGERAFGSFEFQHGDSDWSVRIAEMGRVSSAIR